MQFVSASPFMVILLLLRAFRSFAFTNVRVEESAQQEKQPKKAKFKITPKIVQKIEKKVGAQGYKQGYQIASQILKERVEIPPDLIKSKIQELYFGNDLIPDISCCIPFAPTEVTDISIPEIQKAIRETNKYSASPCSGITYQHLNSFVNNEYFVSSLKHIYDALLNNPTSTIKSAPDLFQYKAIFFAKDETENPVTSLRPISIAEPILQIFHKILLNKIKKPLSEYQYGMQKGGQIKCTLQLRKLH